MGKRRVKKKNVFFASILSVIFIIFLSIFIYMLLFYSPIRKEVVVEATTDFVPTLDLFVKNAKDIDTYTLSSEQETMPTFTVGEYPILIRNDSKEYVVNLIVKDTTAPVGEVVEGYVALGGTITPKNLVSSIEDFSEVTVSFASDYQFTQIGEYNVEILLEDATGNQTIYQTTIHCVDDNEAPKFTTIPDLYLYKNQSDYDLLAGVVVTDNTATDVEVIVEESLIDTSAYGEFYITIIARDSVGNETTAERKVIIAQDPIVSSMYAFTDTNADINTKIDTILSEIITDSMTEKEQLTAIYDWVLENISYRNDANEDYLKNPYDYVEEYLDIVLKRKTGHCFHYSVLVGKLLERQGFEVSIIEGSGHNVDGNFTLHFWIKVKYNGTWYHFDPLFEELYYYQETFFLVTDYDVYGISHLWETTEYDF